MIGTWALEWNRTFTPWVFAALVLTPPVAALFLVGQGYYDPEEKAI